MKAYRVYYHDSKEDPEYRVEWSRDVDAESSQEAKTKVFESIKGEDPDAKISKVREL